MTASGWVRSSACADGSCVEVRRNGHLVEVRDSALGDLSPVIEYSPDDWQAEVIDEIKDGGWLPEHSYRTPDDQLILMRLRCDKRWLLFDDGEWDAFVDGVRAGEFDLDRLRSEPARPSADVLADVDPDSGTTDGVKPASVGLSAASGPVPSDVHPATLRRSLEERVTNLLDEMLVIGHRHSQGIEKLSDADRRTLLTAAVRFANDMTRTRWAGKLARRADEIEASHG